MPESVCLESGAGEKAHFFVVGSFPSGRPGRFQPNPHSRLHRQDVALAAVGFLPPGTKGRSSADSVTPLRLRLQFGTIPWCRPLVEQHQDLLLEEWNGYFGVEGG
jgi:hypothetical protein